MKYFTLVDSYGAELKPSALIRESNGLLERFEYVGRIGTWVQDQTLMNYFTPAAAGISSHQLEEITADAAVQGQVWMRSKAHDGDHHVRR